MARLVWQQRTDNPDPDVICSTPLVHDNHVFTTAWKMNNEPLKLSADGAGKLKAGGGVLERGSEKHPGRGLVGGHVYAPMRSELGIPDFKTGKVKWKSNSPAGRGPWSRLTAAVRCGRDEAEGRPGAVGAEPGEVHRAEQGRPAEPSALQAAAGCGRSRSSPTETHLRDQEFLYCYEVK
jgi:hypothetical protein